MINLEDKRLVAEEIGGQLNTLGGALNISELKKEAAKLKTEQETEGFWDDVTKSAALSKRLKQIENKIARFTRLERRLDDVLVLIELLKADYDEAEAGGIEGLIKPLVADVEVLRIETLLKGKYDALDAVVSLHAGAGGTEAQDWVDMLYRMYQRYCEREGWTVRELDKLPGDDAGIKSVTFSVAGENAYGYLKAEMGVHRLVRISPFDANAKRHTSFASVEVMPELDDAPDIVVRPEDIRVDTYRSGGAGGQHVNKTDSAVRMTHIPTGLIAACQNERSQLQNREQAMKMLVSKLAERQERERTEEAQGIKGDLKKIEWGSQIRSYVFCPYTMVKDHRTGYETGNVTAVMDGDLEAFIVEYLKRS